ncbi:hypothetical protein LIER_24848 [Lithospermum erythrorhizon]|uniref:C2 domain-containing protein n=1 Tax=Lithospermum erythrorhizon TaxID=34254 RepID=A0AAV3R430_LITER
MDFTCNQPRIIEVTIISAQGVKNSSSIFSDRLRTFATASTTPHFSWASSNNSGGQNVHDNNKLYITNVDYKGGVNPTWGYKFQLNLDGTFFSQRHSSIYLNLYSKNMLWGQTHIGWCAIPAADIVGGTMPAGLVGYLSYRLWERDGIHGVMELLMLLKAVVGIPVAMGSEFTSISR